MTTYLIEEPKSPPGQSKWEGIARLQQVMYASSVAPLRDAVSTLSTGKGHRTPPALHWMSQEIRIIYIACFSEVCSCINLDGAVGVSKSLHTNTLVLSTAQHIAAMTATISVGAAASLRRQCGLMHGQQ